MDGKQRLKLTPRGKLPRKKKAKGIVFPIHFLEETKSLFELVDLMINIPVMVVDRAKFVQHIFEFVDLNISYSELYNKLETVDLDELLILWDPMQKFGTNYQVILNKNKINELKILHNLRDSLKTDKDAESLSEISEVETNLDTSLVKWISLGSSIEVDSMIDVASGQSTKFRFQLEDKKCNQPYTWENVSSICCSLDSTSHVSETSTSNVKVVRDTCSQFSVNNKNVSSQCGFLFKRNATTQTSFQLLNEEEIEMHMRHLDLRNFLHNVLPQMESAISDNVHWDLFNDK